VTTLIVVIAVTVAYLALASLSSALTMVAADAWTVWLASGLILGLLLACRRDKWVAILAGAAIGAAAFSFLLGDLSAIDAAGYAAIEVLTALAGAFVFVWLAPAPTRLETPRELAALFAAALVLAVLGGALAAAWSLASGSDPAMRTFRVWMIANIVGTILVAPLVIAWSGFRPKRSGGLTMTEFVAGAVVCVLFFGTLQLVFGAPADTRLGGVGGEGPTYLPIMFMALIALLWGSRGATLVAFAATLLALFHTLHGRGPFVNISGLLGDPQLEVQGYTAAMALTGLLVAGLEAAQRKAMRTARDWRTRFEAAIGAHRLLAYEWDPVSNSFVITGDTQALLGVPAESIPTLADWLAHVAPDERDTVATAFGMRADGGSIAPLAYRMALPDGRVAGLADEAQAIRDHDGSLHRITGIVRVAQA
jgi:integral membrane sensor domain MASE1